MIVSDDLLFLISLDEDEMRCWKVAGSIPGLLLAKCGGVPEQDTT